MMGVPGGLGSERPVGAAGCWFQKSDAPTHENAPLRRNLSGSSLHPDNIHENTQSQKPALITTQNI